MSNYSASNKEYISQSSVTAAIDEKILYTSLPGFPQEEETVDDQYYHLLNEIQDYAIISLDQNGIILNWNQGAEKIKGYTAAEAKGKSFKIFYSSTDKAAHLPDMILEEARTKGKATHEGWRIRKDGTMFWGSVVITSLHNRHGEITGFLKITRDLTEKRHAEIKLSDSEYRFRSIFKSTFQFMGLLKPDGTVLEINQAALGFSGLVATDVLGKPFWKCGWWISAKTVKRIKEAIAQAARGKFIRFETELPGKDANPAIIDFSITPIHDVQGEIIMLLPEGRNITDLRRLQDNILELEEHRKIAIVRSMIKAQEREREKISYELRDNINQILATCLLHIDLCRRTNVNEIDTYIDLVYHHLQDAIAEVRGISQDLNPGALKEIGLVAAIRDLARITTETGMLVVNASFDVSFSDVRISKDVQVCLFRVVQELIDNALRHSKGSLVTIDFSQFGNNIHFVFRDDGVGLDPARNRGGLGLKNIQNRIESFRGQMKIASQRGLGCSVQIAIPIN